MAYTERIRVNYRDVDVMDHVNNAAYFTYMETARVAYYLSLIGKSSPRDLDVIVATQHCDYLRGLRYGETVDVTVWPSRIGTTSFTLAYALRTLEGEVVARAETVLVAYDYVKNAKKPIDSRLRRRLEAERDQGPGFELPK